MAPSPWKIEALLLKLLHETQASHLELPTRRKLTRDHAGQCSLLDAFTLIHLLEVFSKAMQVTYDCDVSLLVCQH